MKVMALRQLAVFMKAGSYVIRPKSSGATLICRRSMARIVPSCTGSSYVFPVRLSVMLKVSGILKSEIKSSKFEVRRRRSGGIVSTFSFFVLTLFRFVHGLAWHPIRAVRPAAKILELAALAAERPPGRIHRRAAAEHA